MFYLEITAPTAKSSTITLGVPGPQGLPGPTGPQGPPGAAFEFTQSVAAAVWTVAHSLGFKPSVSVVSTGGIAVSAEVAHLSDNALEIRFNVPFSGTAHLV
jgi:hypothetical protein